MSNVAYKEIDLGCKPSELGLCENISEAVTDAKEAFKIYQDSSFALKKKIMENIRSLLTKHTETLSKMAVAETGLGNVADKIGKLTLVINKTPGVEGFEYKGSSTYTGDYGITYVTGVPYGIIGAITPSTNPADTIVNNSISMLSAGNVVIFNTHPGAKKVSNMAVMLVNKAILDAGCPTKLIFSIENPTIESSQELMKTPDVKVLVVTGGPAVVKTAMQSGKKVMAAGPGNPPVIVDETAEINLAAKKIVTGASFDNNVLCIAEKEVFVVKDVADDLMDEMTKHNAFLLSSEQIEKVTNMVIINKDGNVMVNKKYIGKDAEIIAKDAGITVPKGTRLLFGEVAFEHPLVQHEQLMPVLPIVRVDNWEVAMDYAIKAEHGFHHTSMMHSTNIERLILVARLVNTAIFVENGHSLAGLGFEGEGYTTMTIAGPTGEGITSPWSFMRKRRYAVVDSLRGGIGHMPHG